MYLCSLLPALLAGVQLVAGAALPGHSLPRADNTCVADDLFRFFRSHRRDATPFCRQFLGSKVETVPVTRTVTLTHTALATETSTATVVSTSLTIDLTTITVTSTSQPVPAVNPRGVPAGDSFAQSVASYPPESLSSACSCLAEPLCNKKAKKTTVTTTTTEDVTQTQTTTTETTTTVGTVVTSSATSTTTQIVIPTYPTRPFRMYSLDAGGTRLYLDRRDWVQGDTVVSTTDASLAETFVIDADQHLFYTDGFSTGTTVYAFYGPTYFSDNAAKVVYFNTPTFITAGSFIYYEWVVDLDTLSMTLASPSGIVLQLCNRVYNSMLMAGTVVDSGCTAVSLFMEYI